MIPSQAFGRRLGVWRPKYRRLYAEKVVAIAWTKELERDGDYGKHFDNVTMEFIRDHVAPLIMRNPAR
jgi:hypothetical protein